MGLDVVVFHFSSTPDVLTSVQLEEAHEFTNKHPEVLCLLEDQSHVGTSWFAITVHRNYDEFMELSKRMREELLSVHPKRYTYPHYERHIFIFPTMQTASKYLSHLKNWNSVSVQKQLNHERHGNNHKQQ